MRACLHASVRACAHAQPPPRTRSSAPAPRRCRPAARSPAEWGEGGAPAARARQYSRRAHGGGVAARLRVCAGGRALRSLCATDIAWQYPTPAMSWRKKKRASDSLKRPLAQMRSNSSPPEVKKRRKFGKERAVRRRSTLGRKAATQRAAAGTCCVLHHDAQVRRREYHLRQGGGWGGVGERTSRAARTAGGPSRRLPASRAPP